MSSAPVSAGEGVLIRPFDSEQATRFEAALEALAPNTGRAYARADGAGPGV